MDPEWLVIIQDREDAGEKRTTSLSGHLAGMAKDPKHLWVLGGYCVDEHGKGNDTKLTGSALIARAPSKDVVEARIKNDSFYKDGVWDPETLMILPYVSTIRQPL
ncbi:hypothetical protein EDB80DRAFT_689267 [Ilyonectria destructans]|nr:hypothetical protein EDB80DRAFT_689267 [Ilyonectria destructans]